MKKWCRLFWLVSGSILLAGGCAGQTAKDTEGENVKQEKEVYAEETESGTDTEDDDLWEEARHTPYGKYPETVTYTLGKIAGANNANMPAGATYENNAYTNYLKEMLNIQNHDVFELEDSGSYQEAVQVAIEDNQIPDIMVVKGRENLKELVRRGLIEDLTTVYEECTADRIKEMYGSYGDAVLGSATFDGKLYAFPETAVSQGESLLWLRKDWMDALGLKDPETLEEGMEIVRSFTEYAPGGEGYTVGLACSTDLVAGTDQTYGVDAVFSEYGAKPQTWILNADGNVVYGSVTQETKDALIYLNRLYTEGILDGKFLLRTDENIDELIKMGQCGAIFGYWWAPNNPLSISYDEDKDARWQPYLLSSGESVPSFESYNDRTYVVVRKGYEYPEIVGKYVSVLFDYGRYDDKKSAREVNEYFSLNVDPTARPLNINVDYLDAIYRVQKNIQKVIDGQMSTLELTGLEKAYYDTCSSWLNGNITTSNAWAAYASRIQATGLLSEAGLDQVQPMLSMGDMDVEIPSDLQKLEKNTFLQIIVGEQPPEYFDTFVESWYDGGGLEITQKAQRSYEETMK